ncbi:CBS domain-containing protein [Methylobacter sp. BlB1]|uniref:CBS domain-containing protein n=1 Tax=Methylobacter sp. BlB1 TaxID=2785914 RepID=UPI00189539A0|nr:CBS domain-containing protein [Methylobacter sp. BlB1]MBF6648212.1 CBS domain-containing protein [Methylobacter sp. BlB1]
MLIRDYMTTNPITVRPETPVKEVADLLIANRINGVPVVDDEGKLLGIVTAEDLIHRGLDERLKPRDSIWKENFWVAFFGPKNTQSDKAQGHTAAEIMAQDVYTVKPNMRLFMAARLMVDHEVTSLPVVEAGKLVGVISRIDLLARWEELESHLEREE